MRLVLQVTSRTESFVKEPIYHLRVQVRGKDTMLTEPFTMKVTKEEFDKMAPGHVFMGELAPFVSYRDDPLLDASCDKHQWRGRNNERCPGCVKGEPSSC